jgi:molecular chaperone GrpE
MSRWTRDHKAGPNEERARAEKEKGSPGGGPAGETAGAKAERPAGGAPPEPSTPETSAPEGAGPEEEKVTLAQTEYQELSEKAKERDLYRNELLRTRADFDNYQKRMQRERPQLQEQAVRRLVLDLLPVLDNFERALGGPEATVDSIKRGIMIVRQMLQKALQNHGIEEIEALGKPFDPLLHHAVVHEESTSYPPDTVSEVLEKGYTHQGSVVRAAQVKVARTPEEAAAPPAPGGQEPGQEDA